METKSIDQYFIKAQNLPLAMSFNEVQALVKIKGVTTNHQSWWRTKNFIFMTSAIIITSAIMLFSFSEEQNELPKNQIKQTTIVKEAHKKITELTVATSNVKELISSNPTQKNENIIVKNMAIVTKVKPLNLVQPTTTEKSALNMVFPIVELPIVSVAEDDSSATLSKIDKDTKIITSTISASDADLLFVSNNKGNISVLTSGEKSVSMKAVVKIKVNNSEDLPKALEDFELKLVKHGEEIQIENNWEEQDDCSCSNSDMKNKIKTKKGEKIEVKNYSVDYILTVPKSMHLHLKAKYGNISVAATKGDVKINSFHGDFVAENIGGYFELKQKYGKTKVTSFNKGELNVFQSKAEIGTANIIDFNGKYADLIIDEVNEIGMMSFQTDINIKNDIKELRGNLKYGDLIIKGNAQIIVLSAFQSNIEVGFVDDLELDASYTELIASNVITFGLTKSFHNDITVKEVSTIKGSGKYTTFKFEVLKDALELKTFQGSLSIDNVLADFNMVDINSKYTPIILNFSDDATFDLFAETNYSNLDFPKDLMQIEMEITENQRTKFKGLFNANNNKNPSRVNLISFQGDLKIR